MDETDKQILDLMKGNARISFQELGDAIGMSRVAAKKRVLKLEKEGIIGGYNTYINDPANITAFIDVIAAPGRLNDVIRAVTYRTTFIRQIFRTTKEDHIHIVAVSDNAEDLKYLTRMIAKQCGDDAFKIECHAVCETIVDVYGGIEYDDRSASKSNGDNKQPGGRSRKGKEG